MLLRYEGLDPLATYEARVVFNAMPEPVPQLAPPPGRPAAYSGAVGGSLGEEHTSTQGAPAAARKTAGTAGVVGGGGGGGGGGNPNQMRLFVQGGGSSGSGSDDGGSDGGGSGSGGGGSDGGVDAPRLRVWPVGAQEFALAPSPMRKTAVPIPRSATAAGRLVLGCDQPAGIAGNGRTCQVKSVGKVCG